MNKLIWIALTLVIVVGGSYQVKRTLDARHGSADHHSSDNTGSATNDANHNPNTVGSAGVGPDGKQILGNKASNPASESMSDASSSSGAHPAGNAGVNAAEKVAVTPEKPKDNCFAFEYRHKKEARDQDIENFLDYTNAFPLAHAEYNPKSVCVKVNQKVVSFQFAKGKGSSEVRVGAMVGPESVIRVSYCVGKISPCHEKCEQPKKRFMDDMMADASDEDSFGDAWGKGEDENHKKDLKNKAKELRAIASENDHLNENSIQRNWDELQKQEWVCK